MRMAPATAAGRPSSGHYAAASAASEPSSRFVRVGGDASQADQLDARVADAVAQLDKLLLVGDLPDDGRGDRLHDVLHVAEEVAGHLGDIADDPELDAFWAGCLGAHSPTRPGSAERCRASTRVSPRAASRSSAPCRE